MRHSSPDRRRGNSVIEFALCAVFLIPLMLGTVNVGVNLSRSIQVTQVSRDAGHMYARFVDFSLAGNQDIIVRLAQGMNMTRTGGNGVVILSKIMFIGQPECEAGGLTVATCPNYNHPVITQRLVIGNAGLRQSSFGTPPAGSIGPNGDIANYLLEPAVRAQNFNSVLALAPGEVAFVSEAYFTAPEYDFPGFITGSGSYAPTIF